MIKISICHTAIYPRPFFSDFCQSVKVNILSKFHAELFSVKVFGTTLMYNFIFISYFYKSV